METPANIEISHLLDTGKLKPERAKGICRYSEKEKN